MIDFRSALLEAYNSYCGNCYSYTKDGVLTPETCLQKAVDFHHVLHDTKYNREKFPLYLDSPMNLIPLCRKCHAHYTLFPHLARLSDKVATVYEGYLRGLKGAV